MHIMKKLTYTCILFLCGLSCNRQDDEKPVINTEPLENKSEFDKNRWLVKDGQDYPYRSEMLEDLMNHPELRKFDKDQVLDLLGKPDRVDSLYLFYRIDQDRLGPWPLHTTTLVIKLSGDSTLNKVMIHK